jgi:hypothetical protein
MEIGAIDLTECPNRGYQGHRECSDDRACIWIRTLISGLSRSNRERWRYLMLQTALDDSGKDAVSTSFALAGYFGSPEQLMDFAHDWDDELKREPKLDYVKAYEAFGPHTQFRGWTETVRDERLVKFIKLIAKHSLKGIAFVIDNKPFSLIRGLKDADGEHFKDPNLFAYLMSLSLFLQALPDFGESVADMVFDYEVISRRQAARAYEKIKTEARWKDLANRLLRPEPHWETDNDFLPLQAADLLAYCVRAERDTGDRHVKVVRSPVLSALKAIKTGIVVMGESYLQYLLELQNRGIDPDPSRRPKLEQWR